MTYAIETEKLTKIYRDTAAVQGLDLHVAQGELFSLLGTNGAGKTTTIKMLSCLTKPTSGDARLMGSSILTQSRQVRDIIGISPQETSIAPNLTVMENLEFIAGIYGNSRQEAHRLSTEIAEMLSLQSVSGKRAKTLSGGWQRRLSIAMALIGKPKILFLDEPTLGLDVLARRELWTLIQKLREQMTIILTTHYLEEAEALSDHIAILSGGRLRAQGTAVELKALAGADNFEDAFVTLACEGGAAQ